MNAQQFLTVLRLAAGGALVGCCIAGLVMGLAGYRGAELDTWRAYGAGILFLPTFIFAARATKRDGSVK